MDKINKVSVGGKEYQIEDTTKQEKLVSGTNIKTINGQSILGNGDITIEGGTGNSDANVQAVDTTETLDDVETNTYVKYVAQTLTEEQKAQVRQNIGVSSIGNTDLSEYAKTEDLSQVAFTGSYNDLKDKPSIDFSSYYNKTEIDTKLGDINTILESIING